MLQSENGDTITTDNMSSALQAYIELANRSYEREITGLRQMLNEREDDKLEQIREIIES